MHVDHRTGDKAKEGQGDNGLKKYKKVKGARSGTDPEGTGKEKENVSVKDKQRSSLELSEEALRMAKKTKEDGVVMEVQEKKPSLLPSPSLPPSSTAAPPRPPTSDADADAALTLPEILMRIRKPVLSSP
ncbi:hypothetical protein ZWY2020_031262 [Hordeum vulgare]|nr:hypothetical protein ZWY2020_031262 [Hordeum vulgare]